MVEKKKKTYKTLSVEKQRIGDLISEMNNREIPKTDIIFFGPTSSGYMLVYLG